MMKAILVASLFLIYVSCFSAEDEAGQFTQRIQDGFEQAESEYGITENTNLTTWDVKPVGIDFPCNVDEGPRTRATSSVNELTPYDIAVIGALGDSLTAGQGAKASTIFTATTQYRGVSFSIGGDGDISSVATLANILRKYNENLEGFSTGKGKETSSGANLNRAVSGSVSSELLEQAQSLVQKIKDNTNIDFENDWKLVTIFIGSNDLCAYCNDESKYSAENYVKNIQETLDYLKVNLPRTYVNLIEPIDVSRLGVVSGLLCDLVHVYACDCIMSERKREKTSSASTAYQQGLNNLMDSGRYDDKDDFTVVAQPFLIGVNFPEKDDGKPDKSYLAPDCFHFSTKSQAETAKALWNNMLEKVGDKNTGWQIGGTIKCPTEDEPYFFTRKNSNPQLFNIASQHDDDDSSSSSLVAIATGSAVGAIVMVISIVVIIVIVIVAIVLKKRQWNRSEHIPLMKTRI